MTKPSLGRLVPVEVRDFWAHEAHEFTPWLAEPDNIKLLGDTLGLQLEVEKTEANVGPFRADILCKDPSTKGLVVIENQLEGSDHGHLGALLTYAAGLETGTIIWVARSFTDQHRAALDWLNRVTLSDVNFFGVEISLWRIGDSVPAPRFTVVSKPNDWAKNASGRARSAPTGVWADYEAYWQGFAEFVAQQPGPFPSVKPTARNWIDLAMGFPAVRVTASFRAAEGRPSLFALCRERQAFDKVHARQADVETRLGPVEWHPESENGWFGVTMPDSAGGGGSVNQHQWLYNVAGKLRLVLAEVLGAGPVPTNAA